MTTRGRRRWTAIAAAGAVALLVAVLGGTITDIGPWYQNLKKPVWQPPDWLFGPAWTLIFALTALSAAVSWWNAQSGASRTWLVGLFVLNGILNLLWSWLFFALKRPDWALVEVVALWLSIVVLVIVVSGHTRTAGWLLVPYLAWVTFAGVLNLEIVDLNGPFSG